MVNHTADHDQRFKSLLKAFFAESFETFFPAWADRFDFSRVDWLEQELFTDPPRVERIKAPGSAREYDGVLSAAD
jgi:hypothetical protein